MCLEMRSLSAQAIGTDGENYEEDAEHRHQSLKRLTQAASEAAAKIRTSKNQRVRLDGAHGHLLCLRLYR